MSVSFKTYDFRNVSDEQLNEYATRFIMRQCWHKFPSCEHYTPTDSRFCQNCDKCENLLLPNWNFCKILSLSLVLVEQIKKLALDEDFPVNYAAFAAHIKNSCLLSNHYADNQILFPEEIFLLYLVKPRHLVEACLLAVDYETKITGES